MKYVKGENDTIQKKEEKTDISKKKKKSDEREKYEGKEKNDIKRSVYVSYKN